MNQLRQRAETTSYQARARNAAHPALILTVFLTDGSQVAPP